MSLVPAKRPWRTLAAGCAAVLAAGFLLPKLVRPPQLDENRTLAEAPSPPRTIEALRRWPGAVDAYVADRFPARSRLIGALNYLRYRLGVSGSERVIVGRDGWLFYDNGTHFGVDRDDPPWSQGDARRWLEGLAGRSEWLRARGAAYLVLIASDKEVIYPEHGPDWYRGPDPDRPAARLARLNAAAQAGALVYPAPQLQQQARWGLEVYNPYETHWTGLGAYQAYVALLRRLQAMGITDGPRPLEAFRQVTDPWKPKNLAEMLGIAGYVDADYPEFADPGLALRTDYIAGRSDWTAPQVIDTGLVGKPTLMMVRDSFSLALLPFLEGHFGRIVLVHLDDGFWRPDLVERFKPDVVVSEIIESGTPWMMANSPPASAAARARIERAISGGAPAAPPPAGPFRREAGPAAKTIMGTDGPDVIRGTAGDDSIDSGAGDDWISGGKGADTLRGGRGADTFHLSQGAGADLVVDFFPLEGDRVELDRGTPYVVRQEGEDTVIEVKGGRMALRGVRAAGLPTGWIVFRPAPAAPLRSINAKRK